MANIKSAEKRTRQAERRRMRNRLLKSRARTAIKEVRSLIEAGETTAAEEAVQVAFKALDKAASKGAIHRNNASRRKSRLTQALNRAHSQAQEGDV